ncbi:hypothetical protein BKA69DRAFT_1070073 [Paraphysoderma sedebokerense]|nr:hypothetical protein BKA69DRAFT_1070073 [Paraphysoderma sedebokerense]
MTIETTVTPILNRLSLANDDNIDSNRPRLTILYGSQTGTAQDVAERLARESKNRHFSVKLSAMDDFSFNDLANVSVVIFICSTTGQGEEPDNMKKFWRLLLRKNLPGNILSHLEYTIFGLGDSSYEKFNFPARKLHKRLSQLGARQFYPRGEGDDQHYLGVDGTLDPWLKGLWGLLLSRFPLQEGRESFSKTPSFTPSSPPVPKGMVAGKLIRNSRITAPNHFQDTRHIEIEVDENFKYNAGDVLCIQPQNLEEEVDELIEYLGWKEHACTVYEFTQTDPDYPLPYYLQYPTTLRDILLYHLDINAKPRRYFFSLLSHFTDNNQHKYKLKEFASAEGQEDLYEYCYRPRRTTIEILKDFIGLKIPKEYIFDLFKDLKERQFSIASSLKMHPRRIHLTVAIVKYKTKMFTPRTGVCTKWLAQVSEESNQLVPIKVTKGVFKAPPPRVPLICIGPGTGIAPMKSFIEERVKGNASGVYSHFPLSVFVN